MMFNNILSKEELDALLTSGELEVFKAEQQDYLDHELTLSPAHLLIALRELESTVRRLTNRVQQLEQQLGLNPIQPEPEIPQVVNQVVAAALFNDEQTEALIELVIDNVNEEETHIETVIEEPYIESINETYIENQIELEPKEQFEGSATSDLERSMLIANDPTNFGELEPSFSDVASSSSTPEGSSLISRSDRHRERKPSIFSRLLK